MRGLGAHIALRPDPGSHFLDEMSGSGDLRLLAFRNLEPGAGERRHYLCAGHVTPFHGWPRYVLPNATVTETVTLRKPNASSVGLYYRPAANRIA
jgi:hypothetical protein